MSTSYFPQSQNVLQDNTFITAQNYIRHVQSPGGDEAFKLLHQNIAEEALHNWDKRRSVFTTNSSVPKPRKAVETEIIDWITNGDLVDEGTKKITWLSGPAGSGKTTIAGTIADVCDESGLLAGTFFFSSSSGSESRQSKRCMVATLAYCLLQHDSLQPLREPLLLAIERDPSIFGKKLKHQCRMLLLKPFRAASGLLDWSSLPKVIIIDGLDEVIAQATQPLSMDQERRRNEAHQLEILACLLQAVNDSAFPFRIIVASRPEHRIEQFFSERALEVMKRISLNGEYIPSFGSALLGSGTPDPVRQGQASGQCVTFPTLREDIGSSHAEGPVYDLEDLEPSVEWGDELEKAGMEAAAQQSEANVGSKPQERDQFQAKFQVTVGEIRLTAEDQTCTELEQEMQERELTAATPIEGSATPHSVRQGQGPLYVDVMQGGTIVPPSTTLKTPPPSASPSPRTHQQDGTGSYATAKLGEPNLFIDTASTAVDERYTVWIPPSTPLSPRCTRGEAPPGGEGGGTSSGPIKRRHTGTASPKRATRSYTGAIWIDGDGYRSATPASSTTFKQFGPIGKMDGSASMGPIASTESLSSPGNHPAPAWTSWGSDSAWSTHIAGRTPTGGRTREYTLWRPGVLPDTT